MAGQASKRSRYKCLQYQCATAKQEVVHTVAATIISSNIGVAAEVSVVVGPVACSTRAML